jgi:hypothetical protein
MVSWVSCPECMVGNGMLTSFWHDRWINWRSATGIAPDLLQFIKPRSALALTVAQARHNNEWIASIQGQLSVLAIVQSVQLWQEIQTTPPLSAEQDAFRWTLAPSGKYSARSAYHAYFQGSVREDYAPLLWANWAPLKEKFFMWLVLRNRCWTGDRLSRRRLPGPARCLLYDQRLETIDHLMVQCPTSRSICRCILNDAGLVQFMPHSESRLNEWWRGLSACQPKEKRKELVFWSIACRRRLWLERNDRAFEQGHNSDQMIVRRIRKNTNSGMQLGDQQ